MMPWLQRLDPGADPLDRDRQRRGGADGEAAFPGEFSSLARARSISAGGRHRVDRDVGLGEGHRLRARDGGATLRGAEPSSKKPSPRLAASRMIGGIAGSVATKRAPMKLAIPA